ncbi:OsmC family peroxiredoxin [Herbiconiux sp. P16]|uniref:OsmC family peroxiredoxin n=1 Tax=Herbiconiux wuyangfengii TaxID=3342794 RepID=UPI0035B99F33
MTPPDTLKATGTADWTGTWHAGSGTISATSAALREAPYSYTTRFVDDHGVAPEELLAAAHASCFNQALAHNLDTIGLTAGSISTSVTVGYAISEAGRPTISGSHITVSARVPGATAEVFRETAEKSARGCSISRVLSCKITVSATLMGD